MCYRMPKLHKLTMPPAFACFVQSVSSSMGSSKLRISRMIAEITYEFVLWVHGDVSEHPCSWCLPVQATSATNSSRTHLPRLPVHFHQRQGCASQRCPAATCRCWWQEMMSVPRPALTWWVLALACIVFGLAGSLPMLL